LTLRRTTKWMAVPLAVAAAVALWAVRAGWYGSSGRKGHAGGGDSSAAGLDVAQANDLAVENWTPRFREREERAEWSALDLDLNLISRQDPDLCQRYRLAYLHARARIAHGDLDGGRKALEPFLAAGDPFRDLALYYAAQAAQAEGKKDEAARLRETLVLEFPKATYRQSALEDLTAFLTEKRNAAALTELSRKITGTVEPSVQRDLESRAIAARLAGGDEASMADGLRFLRGGNLADDAAERVALGLDRVDWIQRFAAEDLVLIGESERNARHFDRALDVLRLALPQIQNKRDDLLFSIGRAEFGREHYEDAEKVYVEGVPEARDGETKATFLYNAARCAQLLGDDVRAEKYLTSAVVPAGKTTRASSVITLRLRIRVQKKRFAEAAADLRAVQARFPKSHAVVEATLAYAIGAIGAGKPALALAELNRIRPKLLEKKDVPEIDYWKARAVEARDPRQAIALYLKVLRSDTPTHFAYFARHRLGEEPLVSRVRAGAAARAAEVQRLLDAGDLDAARRAQTDAALIAPADQEPAELAKLGDIYKKIPAFREVAELPAPEYPRFPLFAGEGAGTPERLDLLLAMGLFDDATDLVQVRYALQPLAQGVARAEALRRGQATRASIYAAETVARDDIPDDFVPQLLPHLLRELLYPRYFYDVITREAAKHKADPRLVLSIMREESRFNPRAKSAAAARGLLQFIITTARDVGQAIGLVQVSPEDLYDPKVVIQLGAKYIGDLLGKFERDGYKVAAAYNAGPNQAKLWARMAPAPGDDMFLSSINFDETKDYVRKVLNSYERYGEIYENQPPAGGVRPDP
jgi:soluble lytic murein transglycosylase-like protein